MEKNYETVATAGTIQPHIFQKSSVTSFFHRGMELGHSNPLPLLTGTIPETDKENNTRADECAIFTPDPTNGLLSIETTIPTVA